MNERWTQLTQKDDPSAHIRTDVIHFVLTPAERSKVDLFKAEAIAAVRRQNALDAQRGLAKWSGEQFR